MKTYMHTLVAVLGLAAALAPAKAQNMDMSWGIRQQMALQARGDAYARSVAQAYYNYMLRLRQMGYTGPSLPTGVTPESLQNSMQRLQNSMDAYHASSAANSNRRSNAVNDYDYRAIRGCQLVVDANGYRHYVCP